MAPVTTFKALAVVLVIALLSLAASGEVLSPASAPAPSPDAGASGSVSNSVAMICASLVLSMIAVLKH
ncbi:hypothetical protein Lal_00029271 [Lupinus albus]|uniref:Uncharacterized protein n=1 Tax=Lupinus albus TaxID=3870 RepID=A0A6A4NUG9_LUPAL|nr:hypothetical protein Lalb_Chr19g0132121 [Lupinus albus]KAF1885382.1 hypothetical protein Lal_00029271 [Lupinus albus]